MHRLWELELSWIKIPECIIQLNFSPAILFSNGTFVAKVTKTTRLLRVAARETNTNVNFSLFSGFLTVRGFFSGISNVASASFLATIQSKTQPKNSQYKPNAWSQCYDKGRVKCPLALINRQVWSCGRKKCKLKINFEWSQITSLCFYLFAFCFPLQ